MTENQVWKNCPRCQSADRYWHDAGIFLVTQNDPEHSSGGFAQAAAVVCPKCGLIEFYSANAALLKELPQAEVPTQPHEHVHNDP